MGQTVWGLNGTSGGGGTAPTLLGLEGTQQGQRVDEQEFALQLREMEYRASSLFPEGWAEHPGYREVAAWPTRFARGRFTRDDLQHALVSAAGRGYATALLPCAFDRSIAATADGYEFYQSAGAKGADGRDVHWQLRRSGLVYQRTAMPEDLCGGTRAGFSSLDATIAYITEAVDSLGRLYETISDPDEQITMRFRMTDTAGRTLSPADASGVEPPTCPLAEVLYDIARPAVVLRNKRATIGAEVVRDVLQQFNWPNPPVHTIRTLVDRHVTRIIYRHYGRTD